MANYAFDLNDKETLKAMKRLHPTRKKEKLQIKNRVQSVFLNMGESSPLQEKLKRPSLRFSTTPVSIFIGDTQYYLIDMKAQTTKYDTDNVDYFEYTLNDDELIKMIQAGMYRGDLQSFRNSLNKVFIGKEFKVTNGVTYYSVDIDGNSVVAYEDQDQSLNSRRIVDSDIWGIDVRSELENVSVQRVLEKVHDEELDRLSQVIIEKEIDFGSVDVDKEQRNGVSVVAEKNTETEISLDEFAKKELVNTSDVDNRENGTVPSLQSKTGVGSTYNESREPNDDFQSRFPPIEIDKDAGRIVYSDNELSNSDEFEI